jgi:hypothetical protein
LVAKLDVLLAVHLAGLGVRPCVVKVNPGTDEGRDRNDNRDDRYRHRREAYQECDQRNERSFEPDHPFWGLCGTHGRAALMLDEVGLLPFLSRRLKVVKFVGKLLLFAFEFLGNFGSDRIQVSDIALGEQELPISWSKEMARY